MKQRSCQPLKNNCKRVKWTWNSIWNKQRSLSVPYLPAGSQDPQGIWQTAWWEPGLHITGRFGRVLYASKKTCLSEERQSSAPLITLQLHIAHPQHCGNAVLKVPSRDASGWQHIYAALAGFGPRGGFAISCRKVQFFQCDTLAILSQKMTL